MNAGACPGVRCPEGLCKDPDVSAGDAVVFQHDLWHQGSELLAGQKETCRTEVMINSTRASVSVDSDTGADADGCMKHSPSFMIDLNRHIIYYSAL